MSAAAKVHPLSRTVLKLYGAEEEVRSNFVGGGTKKDTLLEGSEIVNMGQEEDESIHFIPHQREPEEEFKSSDDDYLMHAEIPSTGRGGKIDT